MSGAMFVTPDSVYSDAISAANLAQHAADARGAYSLNTTRALRSDVAVFSAWCADARLPTLPAAPATVAAFVDEMGKVKAPATVRRYVSSVATFHRAAKQGDPCASQEVRFALRRLHRERGRDQAQAAPLTRKVVDDMLAGVPAGLKGLRGPRAAGAGL